MAAYLLSPPGMPWTDANGDPLNGGLIEVYEAGTSTAADSYPTYADASATPPTNPNTNPVVLNSSGLPSNGVNTIGIWLASGLYNIRVKNSAGVVIQTEDNIGDNSGTDTLPQNYRSDLTLSSGADTDHDITVAAGEARDAADTEDMVLASALTKQIDAAWSVGNDQGGLDTGTVAADTTYYVWLIKRTDTGVVDALFSTSGTSPTLPTNYDKKRQIGRLVTDSSANIDIGTIAVGWPTMLAALPSNAQLTAIANTLSVKRILQTPVAATLGTQATRANTAYGDTGLTATITPKYATSRILVLVDHANAGAQESGLGGGSEADSNPSASFQLLRDSTSIGVARCIAAGRSTSGGNSNLFPGVQIIVFDAPNTTSAITYKTQYKSDNASTTCVVALANNADRITLIEIEGEA